MLNCIETCRSIRQKADTITQLMNVAASQIKALQSSVPNVKALSQINAVKGMVNVNSTNHISNTIKPSFAAASAVPGNKRFRNLSLVQQRQIFYFSRASFNVSCISTPPKLVQDTNHCNLTGHRSDKQFLDYLL